MRMLVVAASLASSPSIIPWRAALDLLRHWDGRIPPPLQQLIVAIAWRIVRMLTGQ